MDFLVCQISEKNKQCSPIALPDWNFANEKTLHKAVRWASCNVSLVFVTPMFSDHASNGVMINSNFIG